MTSMTTALPPPEWAARVRAGDRAAVARAITLIESERPDHRPAAQALLHELGAGADLDGAGSAQRVGITGPPGVGKSTFIDTLGRQVIAAGHRVAVLAVDPSSSRSGGSILGDRTRMARLAAEPGAFVRPSPSTGTLGGTARATRETIMVMESAGYDVVLVETVGVGQSEYVVAGMVDTLLLLTMAGTGDSLQGMKRGILEMADVIAVNKADGPGEPAARRAARELASAHRLVAGPADGWTSEVLTCSGATGAGVAEVWAQVRGHRAALIETGGLAGHRRRQRLDWTRALVRDRLLARLEHTDVRATVADAEAAVLAGDLTPYEAAEEILRATGVASGSG